MGFIHVEGLGLSWRDNAAAARLMFKPDYGIANE
jgi:hypothetical protein